jgi:hypothetical protein
MTRTAIFLCNNNAFVDLWEAELVKVREERRAEELEMSKQTFTNRESRSGRIWLGSEHSRQGSHEAEGKRVASGHSRVQV